MATWERLAEITSDWQPTVANINALPAPLYRFIHDLEMRVDPAGDTRARIEAEALVLQLQAYVVELVDEIACLRAMLGGRNNREEGM